MLGGQVSAYEARTRLGRCRIGVRRDCPRGVVASELFFIFIFHEFAPTRLDSRRLSLIRVDLASIHVDLRRTGSIRPELGRIGWRPKWPKRTKTVETSRNRP